VTTIAPPLLLALARRLEGAFPSAVFSGIVPDGSHHYGFHLSGEDLGWNRGDYSLASDDNWRGARAHPQWAAAFDMSMNRSDMTTVHSRVRASWADPNDSRLSLWYEHIGAINGQVSRLVTYEPDWGEFFDADGTHTWHEHTSGRRDQLDSQAAMDALYSVWTGKQNSGDWGSQVSISDELLSALNVGSEKTSSGAPCYLTTRQIRLEEALTRIEAALARVEGATGGITEAQVQTIASTVITALVDDPGTSIGEEALRAARAAVVDGVKQAFREGLA
jgi:hypothetical protein